MDKTDIKLYTRYEVEFYEHQTLRFFNKQVLNAELVFFKPNLDGSSLLYYKKPNAASGYLVTPLMAENIKSIQEITTNGQNKIESSGNGSRFLWNGY